MSRDVPFDEKAICEGCGKVGAYDFLGDVLCPTCAARMCGIAPADGRCDCAATGRDECVCGAWQDVRCRVTRPPEKQDGAVAPSVQALVGGFTPCCGQPPNVTEWRPGCYGAQCMECGGVVGDERQLDRPELMEAWNRAMRHNRICERAATCDRMNSDGEPCRHGTPHSWDQGCEIGCRAKTPFGAVCMPNDQAEGRL